MKFSADMQSLSTMLASVRKAALSAGFTEKETRKIEVAVEEALVNIIYYAYPQSHKGAVEIEMNRLDEANFQVVIKDQGRPFNPLESTKPPDLYAPAEHRSVGGLGVYLMCRLMDRVEYERKQSENILKLTKSAHAKSNEIGG